MACFAPRERSRIAHAGNDHAAFLLDELQFLCKRDLALLAAAMHGVSQQNTPVPLLAAGLLQLPLLLKSAKPYTERLFDYRTIGGLARSTAAAALSVPAERLGAKCDRDALELILDRTEGVSALPAAMGRIDLARSRGPDADVT